jgi:pilus assembly protein Flp/PilA
MRRVLLFAAGTCWSAFREQVFGCGKKVWRGSVCRPSERPRRAVMVSNALFAIGDDLQGRRCRLSRRASAVAKISEFLKRFCGAEEGASMVEYGLLLALILLVCVGGISQIGRINELFFSVGNTI